MKMRCLKGLAEAGGSGRYGVRPRSSCWKRLGMPGKTQSFAVSAR